MKLLASRALALTVLVSSARAQTTYCTAGASPNFCVAQIGANRQPDAANTGGCVISVSGLPANRPGLVFYGIDNTGFTPTPWSAESSSFRCVKPPTTRLGAPQNSGGAPGACNGTYEVDWDAFQNANPTALGNPWGAGDKVYAQSWYRDPWAPKASNLSNALELTLTPPVPVPCVTTIPGMVVIPAGTFDMGSGAPDEAPYFNNTNQQPVHSVTLSYCFWMGATEVTQAQFSSLMGWNPSQVVGANRPVERVSWSDARAYCAALTAQQAPLGNVPPGYQYRLPTEAEWEYACRAGTTTEFNVGANLFCNQARFLFSQDSNTSCNNSGAGAAPVGAYAPNAWGLYDMHGNVGEWCLDSWASYPSGALTDPFVTGGSVRVIRGGGCFDMSFHCRSASRDAGNAPGDANLDLGFRVVLAPILAP